VINATLPSRLNFENNILIPSEYHERMCPSSVVTVVPVTNLLTTAANQATKLAIIIGKA